MVHIYLKKAQKRYKEEKIKLGELFYECKYRDRIIRSKKYINRTGFTSNPLMKKLYRIDDAVMLFNAPTAKAFLAEIEMILDLVSELHQEFKEKQDKYPPDTIPYIVYGRRLQSFDSYYNKIKGVNLDKGLPTAIKALKKIKINLKPVIKVDR